MDAVSRWLIIPFDRLWWAPDEESVEYAHAAWDILGTTFAFRPQLADFIEGFGSRAELIDFPHLLDLLWMLRHTTDDFPGFSQLPRAYADAGRPLRSAGAFCARLCGKVPRPSDAPRYQDVCRRLRSSGRLFPEPPGEGEELPLSRGEFHRLISEALADYPAADLAHWLAHDAPPPKREAERLAEQTIAAVRRKLSDVVDDLTRHTLLAGCVPYVDRLLGAVTIPPRRQQASRLPMGGFCDLSTRGTPDMLLPSQFALDNWEFVRRFAEGELLYFKREEPARRQEPEVVAVLDQGVRTWGGVRLVLGAAVLGLAKAAAQRGAHLRFVCTSRRDGWFDPTLETSDALAEAINGADLSANPVDALRLALNEPGEHARDIVLLTHPRNLASREVREIARRTAASVRLFALGVDGDGRAEFSLIQAGEPSPQAVFRVDLALGEAALKPREGATEGQWVGDVEPVPYPFRLGLGDGICRDLVAFSGDGRLLAAVGRTGTLHLRSIDGGHEETAPRALLGEVPLSTFQALLGTADGFVLCGTCGDRAVVAHYHSTARRCRVHTLDDASATDAFEWQYSPAQHSTVAIRTAHGCRFGVDLATGEKLHTHAADLESHANAPKHAATRVERACRSSIEGSLPSAAVPVLFDGDTVPDGSAWIHCGTESGTILFHQVGAPDKQFPCAGELMVEKAVATREAKIGGSTVAMKIVRTENRRAVLAVLDVGERPHVVSELPLRTQAGFTVAPDGSHFAVHEGSSIVVYAVGVAKPVFTASRSKCHQDLSVRLHDDGLDLIAGAMMRVVRWGGGTFETKYTTTKDLSTVPMAGPAGLSALPPAIRSRFKRITSSGGCGLIAAVDGFGQTAILDADARLVCMFHMFRSQFAFWMPDGTRWGPESITGGPETPDARRLLAQALSRAKKREVLP